MQKTHILEKVKIIEMSDELHIYSEDRMSEILGDKIWRF